MKYSLLSLLSCIIFICTIGQTSAQIGWQWTAYNTFSSPAGETEAIGGVVVDMIGNVISCTNNRGPDTALFGSFPVYNSTWHDQVIITKADSTGHFLWAIGTQYTDAMALCTTIDTANNIYVFGMYYSPIFYITSFSLSNPYVSPAFFLMKISPAGLVQWVTNAGPFHYGGFPFGQYGFAKDGANNLYVAGTFAQDTVFISSQMLLNHTTQSGYIAKFSQSGTFRWAKTMNARGTVGVRAMTASPDNNLYLVGDYTNDSLIIGGGLLTGGSKFASKLDTGGSLIWAQNLDTNLLVMSLTTDATNALYFVGKITGNAVVGTDTLHSTGALNAAFGKFSPSGTARWAHSASSAGYSNGYSIATDNCGNLWLESAMLGPTTLSGHTLPDPGAMWDQSMFLAEYDTAGHYKTSLVLPFGGDDVACITTDKLGNFYLLSDYITTKVVGADTLPDQGIREAYCIAKYNYNRNPGGITGPAVVCIGSSITLTPDVTGGVWSSTTGKSTVSAGVVTGFSRGIDTIKYAVTNGCGPSVTAVFAVQIIDTLPDPGTISGPTSVCIGLSVVVSESVRGGIWGTTFGYAATYDSFVVGMVAMPDTITYKVTNACGVSTAEYPMMVNPLPDTGIVSGPAVVCPVDSITLSSSLPGGIWTSTNGKATVATGVVTGIMPGVDTISYTVSNTCGSLSAYRIITILPLPDAGVISGPSDICVTEGTAIGVSVTGGVWNVANGNTTIHGDTVFGIHPGVDTLLYAVTNSCGTATAAKTVTVNTMPVAAAITGPSSVCIGNSIRVTDSIAGGMWNASSDNIAVSGDTITGISIGIDTIRYTVTGVCGTTSVWKVISVNALPVIAPISGPSEVCTGATIQLTDPVAGGVWSCTDKMVSVDGGIVAGLLTGTDTVRYSVNNSCGTSIAGKPIIIIPSPNAGVILGPSEFCIGDSITLSDSARSGAWSNVKTLARLTGNAKLSGLAAGSDVVSYSITNECGTAVATHVVTVVAKPDVLPISQNGYELSVSPGYLSYQWMVNGVPIPGATTDKYNYNIPGYYTAIVNNASGCSATFADLDIADCGAADIAVYPNPTESIIYIQWCHSVTAQINCIDGKLVRVIPNATEVDLSALPNAVYIITFFNVNGSRLLTKRIGRIAR